ncbi:hypothetical protein [Atlantibacter sp.]|uniref:T6SS immunity protein Tli3 family protein n=1 Tax=Atlantibacter sp. TaxID=1903473 RepID=UPI0028A94E35|nr:hypothetical protein [Atlantibacter sp.]
MLIRKLIIIALIIAMLSSCSGHKKPPSQVIYRYNESRYLELIGYNCEGKLWYHDNKLNIHKEIYDGIFVAYRIFTGVYVHPSEKYILIPAWEPDAYSISRDYGQTWQTATYMAPYPPLEKSEEGYGVDRPDGKNIKRIVVVNDQAFITTNIGHLYMSSYPFEDPRLKPGGPGVDYTFIDTDNPKGELIKGHIRPEAPGYAWGAVVFMKEGLPNLVDGFKANYQNLPDKEPEVKNYQGWDHMRCSMDAGK